MADNNKTGFQDIDFSIFAEKFFKGFAESIKKTSVPINAEKDSSPTRITTKLEQMNVNLNKIHGLLSIISKSFDPNLKTTKREELFPLVVSNPFSLLLKQIGVDVNAVKTKQTTDKKTNTAPQENQKQPPTPSTQLEQTTSLIPVSIQNFSDNSLNKLGSKLTDILPDAIKKGMEGFISSMEEMFSNLADTVEDSSYQPGLLDSFFGGGGGRGNAPRRGLRRGGRFARTRVRTTRRIRNILPKGMRLSGLGKGLGIAGLIAAPVLGAMEYGERREEGQTEGQAAAGATGSTVGGLAGSMAGTAAGAKLGGMIGLVGGPVGAAAGAIIGGGIGMIGGGLLGSMAGGSIADKMTGVGGQNKKETPLTPEEKDKHDKLVKYVTSLGKYSSVMECVDAINRGKEGRIRWNKQTKQWEPWMPEPTNKVPVPPIVPPNPKKQAEDAQNAKPPVAQDPKKQDPKEFEAFQEHLKKTDPEFVKKMQFLKDNESHTNEQFKLYTEGKYDKLPTHVQELIKNRDPKNKAADLMVDKKDEARNQLQKGRDEELAKYRSYLQEIAKKEKEKKEKQEGIKTQKDIEDAEKVRKEGEELNRQIGKKIESLNDKGPTQPKTEVPKLDNVEESKQPKTEVQKRLESQKVAELKEMKRLAEEEAKKQGIKFDPAKGITFNFKGTLEKPVITDIKPKLQHGGVVPATPGGRDVTVAEGKDAEAIIPWPSLEKHLSNKELVSETKVTNNKLDQLGVTLQMMTGALSKFAENLPQGTTIVNAAGNVQQSQSDSAGIAQYLSEMKSAARAYSGYAFEAKPFAF